MSTARNGRGLQSKASKISKKNLQKQIIFFFSPSLRPYFSFVSPQQEIIAPPPYRVLAFLFISAVSGGDGSSWCFINAPLLFTLRLISDRVCKNRQSMKENKAAAEDYCFISCYFCKTHLIVWNVKTPRKQTTPTAASRRPRRPLKICLFLLKKGRIVSFSKLEPQNFWHISIIWILTGKINCLQFSP